MFAESQRYGQASLPLRNLGEGAYVVEILELRIPIQSGRGFRFDPGHHSDLKPAT